MSILISDKVLIERIHELADEQHQSPEEVVAGAVAAYAAKQTEAQGDFWESMIGVFSSGDPTFAQHSAYSYPRPT